MKLTTHLSSLFSDRSQASLARGLELLGHLCESYPKLLHVDGGALGRAAVVEAQLDAGPAATQERELAL